MVQDFYPSTVLYQIWVGKFYQVSVFYSPLNSITAPVVIFLVITPWKLTYITVTVSPEKHVIFGFNEKNNPFQQRAEPSIEAMLSRSITCSTRPSISSLTMGFFMHRSSRWLIQFYSYFSDGLKPPTSLRCLSRTVDGRNPYLNPGLKPPTSLSRTVDGRNPYMKPRKWYDSNHIFTISTG